MKTLYAWHKATGWWLALLFACFCFSIAQMHAQTGVYAYGRNNVNEGGRVLVDDPLNQRLYIGGYRNDSTLVILVDYNGNLLNEVCFKINSAGGTWEYLTDLKFNAARTELVGCGMVSSTTTTNQGGYAFQMSLGLVLGWVRAFPTTATTGFAPYSVEDLGVGFTDYRLLGTNYPLENGAFVLINKATGTPVGGSMRDFNLTSSEGFNASTIGPGNTIYSTGRFSHTALPSDFRAGIVQLNGINGALNFQNTYMRPFAPGVAARLYPRDIVMKGDPIDTVEVTAGVGDMNGSSVLPVHAFWSAHSFATQELFGQEIRFTAFNWEGAHEVVRDRNATTEAYLIYGEGKLNPATTIPVADQLWLMSMNRNGTVNWSRQYGGPMGEYFLAAGVESQQQLIPIVAGTARIAFTATTTSYGQGGNNAPEDILLVLTDGVGGFDPADDTCIVDPLTPVLTTYVANNPVALIVTTPTPLNLQPVPPTFDPNLQTDVVCGGVVCFAAVDSDYVHITVPTTFNAGTSPTGTETWTGKYYIGADVTIDGIVLDVTETDVVFAPCTRITLINGARLRANNSTFRPCLETDSWEGIYFTSTGATNTSAVVDECVFKNAVDALRFGGALGSTVPATYDARITNNLFVNCLRGINLPGSLNVRFQEGITGNTFMVDNRTITWGNDNLTGGCNNFLSTAYTGINAVNATFRAQVSQNDFINTSDLAPTDLTGILWNRCVGRITLNNFTNNRLAVQLNSCSRTTVENNRMELTQLYMPFLTQILGSNSSLLWIMGNHVVNSTELATYNPAGAAISLENCTVSNVKENGVDGFSNGIQFFRTNLSTINENTVTNCNVVGIVVDGGSQDTVSCNQIKMRLRPANTPTCQGILYNHVGAAAPTVKIKGNCVTDATNAILLINAGVVQPVPRIHNNYLYNYTLNGVASLNFNGNQGSGIATPAQAGRNTFVSNNLLGGAIDVNSGGQPQVWYGNFGISTVSVGVTLIGNGIYHSIASCGHQIGSGNSTIDNGEICDVFMSNIDGSFQRLMQGDYSEFSGPTLIDNRGKLAAGLIVWMVEAGEVTAADNFKAWTASSDLFTPFEKAWVEYHYYNCQGMSGAALAALATLEASDPSYLDYGKVQRIQHSLLQSGRGFGELSPDEIATLSEIDAARGPFADDARDMMHAGYGNYPHVLKSIYFPEIEGIAARIRDVSKESIHLFPNPAETQVTVEYVLENAAGASLRIFDATGRVVLQQGLAADASSTTFDIQAWPSGIYMVSLFNAAGKSRTLKLQVQ